MRATLVIVLLSVIGQLGLGLAQQDGDGALPFSYDDYGGYGGHEDYYTSVSGKGPDSQISRGK
jgi:hypothetical protein